MAEEAKGQRFSLQSGGRLGARIGDQWATQTQWSTQSTWASDTSGVQSSGVFLPWISGVNNKVAPTNDFISGIQSGKIQSNIQLPWITDKTPTYPNATMTAMTPDEIDEMDKIAKKNGTYRESWNDIIHDEMLSNEYKQLLKQWVIQTWNDVRKYSYRKWAELVDYVTKHPYEALGKYGWMWWPFNIWGKLADKVVVDNNPVVKSAWNIASNKMWQWYYKYEDKINKNFEKWVDKNISKTLAEEYQNSGGIWESIKNWDTDNIKYWLVQWFSTSILPMTPWIIAWIVTKNPYITAWVAFGSTAPIEDQEAYEEAIKEWATKEQATEIWKYAWMINGALETVWEFLQIKWLLKPLKKNITKEITKKTGRQIIARWLKEYAQWVWSEALTEWTQEFVTNALIKTINENKDLFEWVLDSIIVWWALSAWPSTLWAWGKVMQDVQNNEIIDQKTDLEALDYVLEWEKRKAQRIEQQKEKMRQRANAIKNPTLDNGYTPTQEEAEQRAKENEEREQFEQERDDEYNKEMQIENDMMNEVLDEWDLNEDLWDPRYQKSDSPQSVSEDTVREKSRTWNVSISSENSSEISKNLNEIKKNLEDLKADTFLQQIKKSISWDEKNSNYITNRINGNKYVLRIADHHANAKNSKKSPYNNTSIVIKLVKRKNNGKNIQFKKYKSVDMMEFVYNPENMTTEKMQGIIDWIQNWIKTGEYTDTNYDSKNQSTRKIWENKKSETEEKYQLKYEEEWYNPWVAGKNEKNISWKEGVNLRNKLNKKTVKELAEKYGIKVEVIEWMIEILENWKRKWYAYWKYIDQLLTLSEQIKESTAPHELLHAIFDMIDPETKTYLISQVMKSEGWSAGKAEERLADSFSNFFRTGKIEWAPKSTWGKIKIFFKRVRSFINGMGKWRNQLDEIFTDIIESEGIEDLQGKIDRNERINKAKERMRERFKQYQKNAEKMQKKAESENKYQKVEDQTQSKAFKKRFGDSKVVDEEWKPMVVYHGTRNWWFTSFNKNDGWIRFSKDIDVADSYAWDDNRWTRAEIIKWNKLKDDFNYEWDEWIYKVYLSIKNPLVLDYEWYWATNHPELSSPSYYLENLSDEYDWVIARNIRDEWWWNGWVNDPEERYAENTVYWVKNPNQVKSATDNVGTYDENNDDIRYQKMDSDQKDNEWRTLSNGQAEYFKDSKVRDGNGNLLVIYHGTRGWDFTVFKWWKTWSNSLAKVWYWFTPSKKWALKFAEWSWGADGKPRAEEVYLNITNPKIYEPSGFNLLSNEEKEKARDEQRKVYNQKANKADWLDYTKAGWFFHDEFDHPYNERTIFEYLKRSWDNDRKYDWKYWKYDPEKYRRLAKDNNVDFDKILKDFEEYTKAKLDEEKEYTKLLDMKYDDPYENFQYDIYKIDSNYDNNWTKADLQMALNDYESPNKFREKLISEWYDGIIIKWTEYDWEVIWWWARNDQYVAFYSNQIKRTTNLNPTDNEDIRYQKTEYEYDEKGNPKRIKFWDNSEFDPSIFWENTKEEQIEEDKENEKSNPFYNAWMKYNNQNYKDDQITLAEFMDAIEKWGEKQQEEYDQKMRDIAEAENDPKMLELQLKAVKLMEKEQNVGKKFWKNVSKEVRDRQQKEVEKERENLAKEIYEWMYPWLRFEEATYDDTNSAWNKEAEWEMLGREKIEEKLRYFKKDSNGNWEKKNIKLETPQEQREKIEKSWNFDEVIAPSDRVIEWKTPEWQKGRIDKAKDPKKFKSVMEKINSWKTKTKVELKDVTNEVRALERYKENERAEKERRKKEKQEEDAKKKQEEYKKLVRMKAFQRLVDMQRFEKYPFLTEEEIKNRYGFSDEEWKTITEQEEIKLPKKRSAKAISDFNKAVDDQVKALIEWLNWQNRMKQKEAEKNLGEIGEIDLDVLLGKDEEKGAREVEEFEKLAKEWKEETWWEKIEEWKTAWEKDMDKKNEKAKKQAEKLTKKWKEDVNDMFRKAEEKRNERYANKEEKVIDEVKTVEEAKEIAKESRWKRTKKFWKDTTIQDLIQPISSRIEKISPRIYLELMRFEQRVAVKTNTRMKQVEDFVKKMAEIRSKNKKDYLNITLHLLNGNVGTANQMLEKYGTSIPRQVLDEIWADAEDVGYTMNYEWFYYPRKVKDVKDFLDRYAKTENANIQWKIDKIVKKKKEQAQKRWEQFTDEDKANLINQLLMEWEVEWISLWSWHMKERKIDSITKNMLEFYEDPVDALLQYITSMTEAVEKARFLWQGKKWEIKSIWEFIADEWITWSDVDELEKLLLSRFNYAPMWNFMRGLKVSANIIHLWSPSSALSQLADISFSLIENWLTNLVQWLANRYNLDLDALGITNRWEELKTQGKNETKREKVQRFTFKWTWFNMMDQFWKKSFVVSTLNKLIKYAKRNDPQLRKDLERWFDDPKMINEIIEDLKEGRMSENVNLFLFTKLADVQPLTRTQMPKTYLQAWNWRVLYAFKTFGIKQLDYLIQTSKRELATKPTAKALWNITAMLWIIMLCGAATDEIKDFTLWRKSSSWIWRMIEGNDWSVSQMSDRFWDNLLKLVWITKYSIYQARTQGIKSTIEDIFFSLPWLDIVTYPLQDIQEAMTEDGLDFSQASSWQLLPIVWKYGYWWAWAGQTKQQKSLEKEKKKAEKEKTTSDRKDKYSDRKKESDRKKIKDKYSDRK